MIKHLKNEFIKFFTPTRLLLNFAIILAVALAYVFVTNLYTSTDTSNLFMLYISSALYGAVLSPIIPVLIIIATTTVITEDYVSGCMKFSLISKTKKNSLIIAKLIFLALLTLIFLVVSFLIFAIVGSIALSHTISVLNTELFEIFKMYLYSAIHILPIIFITVFTSLMIRNQQSAIGISFGVYIIAMVADNTLPVVKFVSPTGGLNYFHTIVTQYDVYGIKFLLSGMSYAVVLTILNIFYFKRKDMIL